MEWEWEGVFRLVVGAHHSYVSCTYGYGYVCMDGCVYDDDAVPRKSLHHEPLT